ncbi:MULTISPECIES: hypothetical protein [unclassified Streptomyces]|uniref:hypothetical protein n=1 Tax=unclassified Streptomyces TaxID=2593676 RepID=UPI001300DC54|nr:hypothetical protein [Streptomyces sp. CB01883]
MSVVPFSLPECVDLLDRGGRLDPGRFVVSGKRSRLDLGGVAVQGIYAETFAASAAAC